MGLTLTVDAGRWRDHQASVLAAAGGTEAVVPVVKGNGYGFGRRTLAAEASRLGAPTLAVGTYAEVADARAEFGGDVLVLSPWRPGPESKVDDERVVHTVSRLDDLEALAGTGDRPRVVLEVLTSMQRHGIPVAALPRASSLLGGVRLEGWALHLPMAGTDPVAEARSLGAAAHAVAPGPLWVSHVPLDALEAVGDDVRLRVGTALWLGDRGALAVRASVLDVHRLSRGDRYGYRGRRATSTGHLLVAAGGTAHGVGLEAPTPGVTLRQRAAAVARGLQGALGRDRSPYRWRGRRLRFAEPPHMQCSLLWLPDGLDAPGSGDELELDVRFTTTTFDAVRLIT